MKLGPKQKKWIAFLKENGHLQGVGRLGKKDGNKIELCCLGVAGLRIIRSCRWDGEILVEKEQRATGTLLDSHGEIGLLSEMGEIRYPSKYRKRTTEPPHLAEMNDEGYTWYEIACYLEAVPELFFSKSV